MSEADEGTADPLFEIESDLLARSEPEERGPPLGCVFVANIANDTSEDAVRDMFGQYGEILKMRLLKDRSARPYAFIQYQTVDAANHALLHGNKLSLDGKRLRIERAKVNRTLFVAKMDRNLSSVQLREMMEKHGPVESVTIIKNHATNKSKGCGFVKFVYREDAMEAFSALKNDPQLRWVVEWATSNNDPSAADMGIDRCNLFVGGLSPAHITKEALEEKFKEYGTLESVTLINRDMDNAGSVATGKSAYAFLRFTDPQSALRAMERENGVEWFDKRKIRVQYCETQEMKNRRKAAKAAPMPQLPLTDGMPMMMDDMAMLNWQMGGGPLGLGMYGMPELMGPAGFGAAFLAAAAAAGQFPLLAAANAGALVPQSYGPPPSQQEWLAYANPALRQHLHQQLQSLGPMPQQALGYGDQDPAGSMLASQFGGLNLAGQPNPPPAYSVW